MFNGRKIGIAVGLVIVIVCGVLVFVNRNGKVRMPMALGAVWRNRIGEGAEQEGSDAFFSGSSVGDATSIDMSNWDLSRVNVVYDTEGVPVPVPKGFVASGADGEHTVNTGFVIYEGQGEVNNDNAWDESCSRNQFVWVPVYDTSRVYEEIGNTGKKKAKLWHFTATGRTPLSNDDTSTRMEPGLVTKYNSSDMKQSFVRNGMQGYTRETFYKELENSFNQDTNSVERYGGYYIGRYETGDIASEQPVVQRMNIIISNQTWYAMYPKMKNISTNENVETNMIWGCLFDETLQWLIDTGDKTQDEIASGSGSWGNYERQKFTYTNQNGGTSTKDYYAKIPTGSTERNKANNIYDLAGNVSDWTLEGKGTQNGLLRSYRGGNYGSNMYAAWRRKLY